jgi:uncharacterized protein DUF4410
MNARLLCVVVIACSTIGVASQSKPQIVVQPFTTARGVELPYDLNVLQAQLVAELKVMLGSQFNIVAAAPALSPGEGYSLEGEITAWRPGNAAKRMLVGMGSGREASDVTYRLSDASGKKVLEREDTVRTNFYSQAAGSTGTLTHPIAQKIADRIKDARLK